MRHSPLAKPSPEIFLHRWLSSYYNLWIVLNDSFCTLYCYLSTNIQMPLLSVVPWYASKWDSRSSNIKYLETTYSPILSNIFWVPILLLVSITVTVINLISASSTIFHIQRINSGTFVAALKSWCVGLCWSLMPLFRSTSVSSSASQSFSLTFGLSKYPVQLRQLSVSEMIPGPLPSSLSNR